MLILWLLLGNGQFRIEVGVVSLNGSFAALGRVFSADANWLCGSSMLLGKDGIFKIKARAILEGLRLNVIMPFWWRRFWLVELLIVKWWNYALFIEWYIGTEKFIYAILQEFGIQLLTIWLSLRLQISQESNCLKNHHVRCII